MLFELLTYFFTFLIGAAFATAIVCLCFERRWNEHLDRQHALRRDLTVSECQNLDFQVEIRERKEQHADLLKEYTRAIDENLSLRAVRIDPRELSIPA